MVYPRWGASEDNPKFKSNPCALCAFVVPLDEPAALTHSSTKRRAGSEQASAGPEFKHDWLNRRNLTHAAFQLFFFFFFNSDRLCGASQHKPTLVDRAADL